MELLLDLQNEIEAEFEFDPTEVAFAVAVRVLETEGCPFEKVEVAIGITDNAGIREYNRDFRQIDKETDVLSFPNLEYESPAEFDIANEFDCIDPETGAVCLGDMILSVDRIRSQALEYGHSQKREFAFLVAHSMLHLCGYDHMEPDEAADMEARQAAVLDSLGITRDI